MKPCATACLQRALHIYSLANVLAFMQAVKAMHFEGDSKKKLETAETIRERAIQDEELAKQIQEEEGDDFS